MKKILSVMLILFFLICTISNIAFATSDNFNTEGFENEAGDPQVNNATKSLMGTGIEVIRTVGTGISIIMLSYMGIKYMMASANERAEFKKSMSIFVLGAVLVFAASNILAIIVDFANGFKF